MKLSAESEKRERNITSSVRKIQKIGNTFYIALPPEFIRKHGLVQRDQLAVISDSIVKIVPMQEIA